MAIKPEQPRLRRDGRRDPAALEIENRDQREEIVEVADAGHAEEKRIALCIDVS